MVVLVKVAVHRTFVFVELDIVEILVQYLTHVLITLVLMAVPVKPLDQAIYVFALHSIPEQIVKHTLMHAQIILA